MTDALIERLEKGDFRRCPFDDDNCKLMPEDACPVCGDMGTFEDNPTPSNCVSSNQRALANEAAQALKAKDAEIERLRGYEKHLNAVLGAWHANSGAEPSVSVLGRAVDEASDFSCKALGGSDGE